MLHPHHPFCRVLWDKMGLFGVFTDGGVLRSGKLRNSQVNLKVMRESWCTTFTVNNFVGGLMTGKNRCWQRFLREVAIPC
jgi:hypothetical protein